MVIVIPEIHQNALLLKFQNSGRIGLTYFFRFHCFHTYQTNGQCPDFAITYWLNCCDSGYVRDEVSCNDINECDLKTHNCDENASCLNTPGSFTCTCNRGYEGSGISCERKQTFQWARRFISADDPSGSGDHENLNGPPSNDDSDNCAAIYYDARVIASHRSWLNFRITFTRLSDRIWTYLEISDVPLISQRYIPVEYR